MSRFFRSALFPLIVIVLLVYLASQTLLPRSEEPEKWTYSQLINEVEAYQRSDLHGLTRRLARVDRLRHGLGEARAAATLHMLTSLETFLRLRRAYGLSLRQTRETIAELALTLLRD